MKTRVQAQHLQPGDVVGSGEVVKEIIRASISFPATVVMVTLDKGDRRRSSRWNKYTMINVERKEKVEQ